MFFLLKDKKKQGFYPLFFWLDVLTNLMCNFIKMIFPLPLSSSDAYLCAGGLDSTFTMPLDENTRYNIVCLLYRI